MSSSKDSHTEIWPSHQLLNLVEGPARSYTKYGVVVDGSNLGAVDLLPERNELAMTAKSHEMHQKCKTSRAMDDKTISS